MKIGRCTPLQKSHRVEAIGVGSVTNCTNGVMVALLDQHDKFMYFPMLDSDDMEKACQWVEERTCPEWQNGIFAIDGSATNLMNKLGLHGKVFSTGKILIL
jgi:hypothetical protein